MCVVVASGGPRLEDEMAGGAIGRPQKHRVVRALI